MRVPGFCTECRRPKQVRVSGHGIATLAAHAVANGVCFDCEDLADHVRWARSTRGAKEVLRTLAQSRAALAPDEISTHLNTGRVATVLRGLWQQRLVRPVTGGFEITPRGRDVLAHLTPLRP